MGTTRLNTPFVVFAALDAQMQRNDNTMTSSPTTFVYIGTYPDEATAQADYDVVKDLHSAGAIGTYDAAVVTKDDAGKVHVNKDETATRHGAWGGAAVGAVVGILFPPAIIASRGGCRRWCRRWPPVAWHVPL